MRQTLPDDALDATGRAILNALQDGFPLVPQPFEEAGRARLALQAFHHLAGETGHDFR